MLTQTELDEIDNPKVPGHPQTIELRSKCHPSAGVRVLYEKDYGILELQCLACGDHVCGILVAEREGILAARDEEM